MNGKTGLVVVTPLVLDGSGQGILVQRGWVMRNFEDRTKLPDIQTPSGTVTVHGRIAPPPSKLYEFKGVDTSRIRQNIGVVDFSRETGLPLMSVSMVQTGPANEGLLREWAAPNVGIDKHYGYAFQWFALSALVAGLYTWFQIIHPWRVKRKQALHA
jgi:surfeit locus 1 family protein